MNRLIGKIALVTGGASGMGEFMVRRFIAEGATTLIADIDDARGTALARELGSSASYIHLDTTDEVAWETLTAGIRDTHGYLDILVNSAGVVATGSVEECTLAQWNKVLAVNLGGVFLGCKHAVLLMKDKSRSGSIINIASDSALRPTAFAVAYVSSKAAVLNLTRSTALHCAQSKYAIRCNAILPGVIETPMLQRLYDISPDPDAMRAGLMSRYPMGRPGQSHEVANAALFLASDESSFITGISLPVDGGCTGA